MSLATAILPTDPDALRGFAARLQAELYAKTPLGRLSAEGLLEASPSRS